jgi:hypothetical protein
MNLEVTHAAAVLAVPSVSLEYPSMEFLVEWGTEPGPRPANQCIVGPCSRPE